MLVSRFSVLALLAVAGDCPRPPGLASPVAAPAALALGSDLPVLKAELSAVPRVPDPIGLNVVYPAPTDLVRVRDSSFLFGSVANGNVRVTINGSRVRVWPNGAWLAWLAFPLDSVMQFRIEARLAGDSAVLLYPVRRDLRYFPLEAATGSAWIDTVSLSPKGALWLPPSEYLTFSARAAEGSDVRLLLPGGEIAYLLPQRQPEEVLPATRAFDRDTSKLRTPDEVRYVGVVRGRAIGPDPGPLLRGASASLIRVLARAALRCVTGVPCPAPYQALLPPDSSWAILEAAHGGDTVRVRWPLQLALLDTLPIVAQFDDDTAGLGTTDSTTIGRAEPGGTYHWFFPTGTRGSVTGRINDDLRIGLSPEASAWVPVADAQPLPPGIPAPHAVVGSMTLAPAADRVTLRIPLSQRVPFQVIESDRALAVRLYSATGDVDWIRYGTDPLVQRLSWGQPDRDEVTLNIELAAPVWGYRARWSRNDLLLDIRRPPRIVPDRPLQGRTIALDPGHPPLGATGPTGLREADANLAVALELRTMLEKAGARVLMTRTTDTAVDLWPRVQLADTGGAELLVSIHNNALPDGVNPFTNNGTSVFYNQPRSVPLATEMQRALVRRLGLPDLGIIRGDLAVVRPTWMPSVLCEGMFVILPDQETFLRSSRGQWLYARGVFDGIARFLRDRARDSPQSDVVRPRSGASP
ncbi:MAG: N-acetylmuramoyl-L-alanine amidase [Gemmatimonadales bacterium]